MNIQFYRGVEKLKVDIIDFDLNQIIYKVDNVPVHTYDQHSRARIGVSFTEYEISEEPIYCFYTEVYDKIYSQDEEFLKKLLRNLSTLERRRLNTNVKEDSTLMSRKCSYKVTQNYQSLRGQMNRRLKLCEEEQIVGLHWLLRKKMIDNNIEVANSYLPGCDITGICDYIAVSDHLSNAFGALFDACGRWEYDKSVYRSFNKSCTTPELLKEQLGIEIPKSKYEIELNIR